MNTIDNDTLALSFLTWLDTLERLDTLLLETRHLQKNILYFLREPTLYYPLAHEEKCMWLNDNQILERLNNIEIKPVTILKKIVDQIVIPYPSFSPQENVGTSPTGDERENIRKDVKKIVNDIEKRVDEIMNRGLWNGEQRSHYLNLRAIQKIKRNILRDKLLLCHYGIKTFEVLFDNLQKTRLEEDHQLWRFILLRCLILARARNYVDRLGDHQDIFTNNQDVGLLHPRPSARRRREQDLYNVYLSDRCWHIWCEMNLLMKKLLKSEQSNKFKPSFIFHHWQHDFSSASFSFTDELEDPMTPHQHYIKTSYWMPERPDLQSEIAHEVAHSVMREWLGNLSWQELDSIKSHFCLLLKQLNQCCVVFEVSNYNNIITLREIAVDLLATAVAGPAYLYALFLELLGFGLEDMFATNQSDQFEVGLIDYLESIIGPYSNIRDWYYRLHLVCTWLEEIDEAAKTDGSLCKRLIDSCRKILEGLHGFPESNAPQKDKHRDYWCSLKKRLCEIVKNSDVVSQVKDWRKERRNDYQFWNGRKWKKGEHKFPLCTRSLHPRLRNFLFEGFIGKKITLIKKIGLPDEKTKCKEQIENIYNLKINEKQKGFDKRWSLVGDPVPLICESLFEQIYDIPWQCGFLRGLDFVNPKSHIRPKSELLWFEQMHEDAALGRELYQLGLDFYLHDIEPARNRLLEIVRILSFIKPLESNGYFDKIRLWKQELVPNVDVDNFIKSLQDLNQRQKSRPRILFQNECKKKARNSSPDILLKAYLWPSLEEDIQRLLIKLQSLKLEELLQMFKELSDKEPFPEKLKPLRSFLEIRDQPENSKNPLSQGFHSFLFQAFSKNEIKEYNQPAEQWNCPDTYLISRICSTCSLETSSSEHTRDRFNAYRAWSFDSKNNKIIDPKEYDEIKNHENYQVLLGRYDWLTIRKLKPMCRYGVTRFPSDKIDNEPVFLNNFSRREMALPVRLGTEKSWDDVHKWDYANGDHNIFALISIKLNRYTARLDFLTRLLHVTRESKTEDCNSNKEDPCNLNQLKGYIHEKFGDRAFLTDGWGDILLILGNERLGVSTNSKNKNDHEVKCLKDIFKIQSVLFEDFQVDHTELILTPKCLNIAVRDLDSFSVVFQFRLMGDCTLEKLNRDCVESIRTSIKKSLGEEEKLSGIKFNIYRIPGRMDYMVQLEKVDGCGYKLPASFFGVMLNIFFDENVHNIDRLQTTIGIQE